MLKSYSEGRTQRVILRSKDKSFLSNAGITESGVPQGSLLGSLLFLIYYVNGLDLKQSHLLLYADSTSAAASAKKPKSLNLILHNQIGKLIIKIKFLLGLFLFKKIRIVAGLQTITMLSETLLNVILLATERLRYVFNKLANNIKVERNYKIIFEKS